MIGLQILKICNPIYFKRQEITLLKKKYEDV